MDYTLANKHVECHVTSVQPESILPFFTEKIQNRLKMDFLDCHGNGHVEKSKGSI